MPSPRRNGKRGKDKPVVIIFKDNPIGYLGGMALSGEGERCIKFVNKDEARAWVMSQKMLGGVHDVHLCSDILKHIDKGEKVIRCDSCFTYGPNSIWAGRSPIYDYGIDIGHADGSTITTRQGAESASASESAISSAHAGSRVTIDGITRLNWFSYEQPDMFTSQSDLFEATHISPIQRVSEPAEDSGPTVEEIAQPGLTGQTDAIGPNLRAVLDEFRASRIASESASNAAFDAANEERARQARRYIEEFLAHGRDPMSYCEDSVVRDSGDGAGN